MQRNFGKQKHTNYRSEGGGGLTPHIKKYKGGGAQSKIKKDIYKKRGGGHITCSLEYIVENICHIDMEELIIFTDMSIV